MTSKINHNSVVPPHFPIWDYTSPTLPNVCKLHCYATTAFQQAETKTKHERTVSRRNNAPLARALNAK